MGCCGWVVVAVVVAVAIVVVAVVAVATLVHPGCLVSLGFTRSWNTTAVFQDL